MFFLNAVPVRSTPVLAQIAPVPYTLGIMSDILTAKSYKGFDVLSVTDIPDFQAKGLYLRHRKTGLEVFHLSNDDTENLFAFAFRTPPEDSCGTPHILEHSVLCGSDKYPIKDPFIRMLNQSVKTFLNALTFPDKTVFPASTIVEKDYFNLMSVYGDAVFFPKLTQEIFMQEAHHLELADDGSCSIQGVVYNEMKGNYSSFDSVSADATLSSLFPGTVYAVDSGGDPLSISSLTYKQFKAFHDTYYHPGNCLVFLYGNIPTEKQLDFLQQELLDRLERRMQSAATAQAPLLADILKKETVKPFSHPVRIDTKGPASEAKQQGATVTVNWLLGNTEDNLRYMESIFLSEILCGHDGSPLIKALLESGLGEDIAPETGITAEMRYISMTAGLRGVSGDNIKKVELLIFKVLDDLYHNGISKEDIEAACMTVNFANREIKRGSGPYSLVLMRRALRSWAYGAQPAQTLCVRNDFAVIQQRLADDPDYIKNLIHTLFIENKHRSLVSVTPDPSYGENRKAIEQKIISEQAAQTTKADIKACMDRLHAFQQDSGGDAGCLPRLPLSELTVKADVIPTQITELRTGRGSIPLITNTEGTAGINYVDIAFPVDVLDPQDYPYLPFLSDVVTACGWGRLDWAQAAAESAKVCGGFGTVLYTSSCAVSPQKPYEGRDWLIFKVKMLAEKTAQTADLIADCLMNVDFSDTKRLQDLAAEWRNNIDASVIPGGHDFAAMRAVRHVNRTAATEEIWNGISQVFTAHKLAESPIQDTAKRLASMFSSIKAAGCLIHITSDKESRTELLEVLAQLAEKAQLTPVTPRAPQATADTTALYALTDVPGSTNGRDAPERCVTQSQIGFAAMNLVSAPWGTPEAAAEQVLAHWLSHTLLWEQIRTIGGAYGAFASADNVERTFTIATYRDPTPVKSLDIIRQCLKTAAETLLDPEQVEQAVTGAYSREIQPRSPSGRGSTALLRALYCIPDDIRLKKAAYLLQVTPQDLQAAAKRIYGSLSACTSVVICSDAQGGAQITLPI